MNLPIERIHSSWQAFFAQHKELLDQIFQGIGTSDISPNIESVFRAFEEPLENIRAVIFGQDPYPGFEVADGLAFSSASGQTIPASLRNIFKEYHADLGFDMPTSPDLTRWSRSGVMLLNRTLTTVPGERNAHVSKGWTKFTYEVAEILGERDVVAILWGNYARELAPLFTLRIESPHPSPLSARLGFFGSQPFSMANELLLNSGKEPIDWKL